MRSGAWACEKRLGTKGRSVTWLLLRVVVWRWRCGNEGRVVCIFHEVADELGVISRAACGLQDERDKVDVRVSVNFDLLCSLGHVTWGGCWLLQ